MMKPELLVPTSCYSNSILSFTNPYYYSDQEMEFFNFSSPDQDQSSSVFSSNATPNPIMFMDESFHLQNLCDEYHEIIQSTGGEIDVIREWLLNENDEGEEDAQELRSPCCVSLESGESSIMDIIQYWEDQNQIELLLDDYNDDQLSLFHLLKAYGEAIQNGEKDLSEVIFKSINGKSSAMGNTMERVAFNLFHSRQIQGEYLRQESINNLIEALMVFYKSLPIGRFAHFTVNSIILEAIPNDVGTVHIVDFDVGEGIQWPPLIEALARKHKDLKLTCVKLNENCSGSYWDFEETKKRLQTHAKQCGMKLRIEEKSMKDVGIELTRMNKRGEWLVFNCLVGLPHMGRRRPRIHVLEFLKLAQKCLASFNGILTLGDGEEGLSFESCTSFKTFFDKLLGHYHALFEALESNFPTYLAEARTSMESLFFGPFMNTFDWLHDWEEMAKSSDLGAEMRLEGRKLSQESLAEAKEMVNDRDDSFKVKTEGYREHLIVLEWKNTPLLRVSTWM